MLKEWAQMYYTQLCLWVALKSWVLWKTKIGSLSYSLRLAGFKRAEIGTIYNHPVAIILKDTHIHLWLLITFKMSFDWKSKRQIDKVIQEKINAFPKRHRHFHTTTLLGVTLCILLVAYIKLRFGTNVPTNVVCSNTTQVPLWCGVR